MNNEMEKNRGDAAPHPMDDGSTHEGGEFKKFERFESSKGYQSEHEGGQAGTNNPLASPGRDQREQPLEPLEPLEHDKLEERFRKECRKNCRRNLLVELLKTVAKVAGVILAAMGLSSFGEED